MRITKKVFTDLGIFMTGFGVCIGLVFPPFMRLIGVPAHYVFTWTFFASCIAAGVLVGLMNYGISRAVVASRLKLLAESMQFIRQKLNSKMSIREIEECTKESCLLLVDSEDEIGESAQTFNHLVESLALSLKAELSFKEFNEILSAQLEIPGMASKALDHLVDYTRAAAGAILLERGGDLVVSSSFALQQPELLSEYDGVWKALKQLKRLRIPLDPRVEITHTLVSFRPAELLIEPLVYKGTAVGAVLLASSRPFTEDVMYGFEMCCKSLSLALRNAVTYEQLQKLAANDPLTGVYNRRFGLIRLQEEFARAVRSQTPVGLMMIDIDHFKAVNDTYGHTVGDKVLVNMTRITKMALREGDQLIRYGGEEFLVIMPGASRHDCEFVAERLIRMVAESVIQHGEQQIHITVSAGNSSYPETEVSQVNELVSTADAALYQAKEQGRNRFVTK